jgi:thiaminase/transcriptional activator TenA
MAVTTSFFAELCDATNDLHQRTLMHPMVRGIGNGTLSEKRFRYYIEQDYLFLLQYVRVLTLASASARNLDSMFHLTRLVYSTIDVEIDALRSLYTQFGGDNDELDEIKPAPTCEAYTRHLLSIALQHELFVTMAAILPCQWGYGEIGRILQAAGLPADSRYAAWIEEYASTEYGELVDWALVRFDELADDYGPLHRRLALEAFELSSRYELAFWEMAWTRERWTSG